MEDAHRQKMQRRQQVQEQRLADRQKEKGLVIVHTGEGKGKTTAALGMVLRSLGHGFRVAIVQFIKGAWEPAEKKVLAQWRDQIVFQALGEGFTWNTQDRDRDIACTLAAWEQSKSFLNSGTYHLVLLDEINVAMKLGYLDPQIVIDALAQKPTDVHIILTGRGAPPQLIECADLVTEMRMVKHPFREQNVKAQAGIEY